MANATKKPKRSKATALDRLLKKLDACEDARKWAKGMGQKQAWKACPDLDWMRWILGRLDVRGRPMRLAAFALGEDALDLVKEGAKAGGVSAPHLIRRIRKEFAAVAKSVRGGRHKKHDVIEATRRLLGVVADARRGNEDLPYYALRTVEDALDIVAEQSEPTDTDVGIILGRHRDVGRCIAGYDRDSWAKRQCDLVRGAVPFKVLARAAAAVERDMRREDRRRQRAEANA